MEGTELRKQKFVIVGHQGSGKTSVLVRLLYDSFHEDYMGTIGIDFISHTIKTEKGVVRIQLWDTAGQERFHALIPTYVRGAKAALIVYDVTDPEALEKVTTWKNMIDLHGSNPVIALCANKIDLEETRRIGTEEGRNTAKDLDAMYMETSAKTGHNVKTLFKRLASAVLESETPSFPVGDKMVSVILHEANEEDAPVEKWGCC